MSFGSRLRQLREDKGLTQGELGEIVNLTKGNISKYENDTVEANNETLKKLADYFDVSTDYLLGKSDITNPYIEEHQKEVMPEIPEQFTDPDLAREYVSKHKIFGAHGFRPNKMSDEKILEFANAILDQMTLLGYKYKK